MIYTHDTGAPLTKEQWDYNFQQLATRYELATGTPMSVILRQNLNRALMNREVDSNFQNLDAGIRRLEYGDGPYPVLDQTFVGASFLDPRITHTRPGKSWRIVNGVIREYDVNEPVLTPDGWSLRPAETNLAYPSEDLQSPRWTKANVSAASATDLIENSSLAVHNVMLPLIGQSYTSGKKYTFMADVEPLGAGSKRYLQIILPPDAFGGSADTWAMIDPTDGSVVHKGNALSVQVDPLAGGVFSVNVTATAVATVSTYGINLALAPTPVRTVVYQGDGASGLKVHRVMLSEGDPKPYIPTTSGAVTRPADNASIQGSAFTEVFNPSEGAIVFDCDQKAFHPGSHDWLLGLSDGTTINFAGVSSRSTDIAIAFAGQAVILPQTALAPRKYGIVWGGGSFGAFMLGDKKGEKAYSGDPALLNRMQIGGLANGNTLASAITARRLRIFTRRPSDAQMMEWTS